MTFILSQVDDGVATLTISRPQAGNALNWAVFAQLSSALARAADSPDVRAVVIAAAGSRFSSGADLGHFVRYLEAGDVPRVVDTVRASQDLFAQIAKCPKPVVAAVQGAAVGGGAELALACHRIVATPRASFSFPETGLGILPFSGGTYRTPGRIGTALTKWLVYTGHVLSPPKAVQIGFIDQLVMPEALSAAANAAARALCDHPTAAPRRADAPAAEFAALHALFDKSSVSQLHIAELPEDRAVATALKAVASRPLPALQWAEKLIDAALAGTPDEGAKAALQAVPDLCGRPDVRETMTRVARQQRQAYGRGGRA